MTTETRSKRALLKPLALLGVVALVLLLFMAQDQPALVHDDHRKHHR